MPVPTRDDFMLGPDLVFLNHGSFGAVPRVVHDEYVRLHRIVTGVNARHVWEMMSTGHSCFRTTWPSGPMVICI